MSMRRICLDTLGICVLTREEAAFGVTHLAEEVVQGVGRDSAVPVLSREQPCPDVELRELRVVVEHLLEVRDVPGRVGRVAREPTSDLVVDPAEAIRSKVVVSISSASGFPRTAIRRTNSNVIGCGNFGAPPKPPHRSSKSSRSSANAPC